MVIVIDPTALAECVGSDVVVVDDDVVDDVGGGDPWPLESTTTVRARSARTIAMTWRRRRTLLRRTCLAADIGRSVAARYECAFGRTVLPERIHAPK
jgi:hypothetical protein